MSNGNGKRTTGYEIWKLASQIQDALTKIEKKFGISCEFKIIRLPEKEDIIIIKFSKKIRKISAAIPRKRKGSINAIRKIVLVPLQSLLT